MADQVYLNPEARVEVVWRLVGQEKWKATGLVGELAPAKLLAHNLLCGLDHGVKVDPAFRQGAHAQFGYRLAGEEAVCLLTGADMRAIFERYHQHRGAERCKAALNSVLKAMGEPTIVRLLAAA